MPTPNIQLEDLLDLREELRHAGFDPGLQRAIAAHNLLLALAANGRLPAEPAAWRAWLAPVFCSAPGEQEEFYRRFNSWAQRHAQSISQTKESIAAAFSASGSTQGAAVRSSAFRRLLT